MRIASGLKRLPILIISNFLSIVFAFDMAIVIIQSNFHYDMKTQSQQIHRR